MPVNIERLKVLEQPRNLFHVGFFVDGGVGAHHETGGLGSLDPFDGLAEDAVFFDADVMRLFEPVQMHVEKESLVGCEFVQALHDEHAVGAQVDVLIARENSGHELADLRIHHGLAAADRHHRRAALIHRRQAFFERNPLSDSGFVFADAPAAGAGKIAGVQRLEHEHDREPLVDHGMRLPAAALSQLCRQNAERVGGVQHRRGGFLPLRLGPHLVFEDVPSHTSRHGKRESHARSVDREVLTFANSDKASKGK